MPIAGACQAATFEGSSWFMPGDRRHISGRQTGPRLSPKRTEADRRIVREWPTIALSRSRPRHTQLT